MIDRFLYLVSEGIRSLWRTKSTVLATITAIGIASSFVVIIAVVVENVSGIIQIARGQYEFQVFFSEDVDNTQAAKLVDQIGGI